MGGHKTKGLRILGIVFLVAILTLSSSAFLVNPNNAFSENVLQTATNQRATSIQENPTTHKNSPAIGSINTCISKYEAKDDLEISTLTNDSSQVISGISNNVQNEFQVSTDYGYNCSSGDPSEAIQAAINSLPKDRTNPSNIYLNGAFDIENEIVMANNLNFIGNNCILVSDEQTPIFTYNSAQVYNQSLWEPGDLYWDWVMLENVTFQSIHFIQISSFNDPANAAIYFYDGNATGWGICYSLNVYSCEFEGFYNCIQGIARYSQYFGNYFHDYVNNGIMFPAGYNLRVENNTFVTPGNMLTVEDYQERDGSTSIQGGIGLFFMDVGDVLVMNNTFQQGSNSTGLTFSSSIGDLQAIGNIFSGKGNPYSIDVFPRPFLSSGVIFSGNINVNDFMYDNGVYTNI